MAPLPRLGWSITIVEISFLLTIVALASLRVIVSDDIVKLLGGYGFARGAALVGRGFYRGRVSQEDVAAVPPSRPSQNNRERVAPDGDWDRASQIPVTVDPGAEIRIRVRPQSAPDMTYTRCAVVIGRRQCSLPKGHEGTCQT